MNARPADPDTTPLAEATWLLDELDAIHPLATNKGDRVRHITRDLRAIVTGQDAAIARLTRALTEELDREREDG